jgi:hypothetical protein
LKGILGWRIRPPDDVQVAAVDFAGETHGPIDVACEDARRQPIVRAIRQPDGLVDVTHVLAPEIGDPGPPVRELILGPNSFLSHETFWKIAVGIVRDCEPDPRIVFRSAIFHGNLFNERASSIGG